MRKQCVLYALVTFVVLYTVLVCSAIPTVYKPLTSIPASGLMSAPCLTPTPSSLNFDIFCQFSYHSKPYICDPSGALSRTEIEMLDASIRPLNFTTCFCEHPYTCEPSQSRFAIVVVPSTSIESLGVCDISMEFTRPYTLAAAALIYAEELAHHWMEGCKADLMIIYIHSFDPGKLRKPYIVPLYRYNYAHLSRFSHPLAVARRRSVYAAINDYLKGLSKIVSSKPVEVQSSVPDWAILVSFAFVALAFFSIYIGNCITNRIGTSYWQSKPSSAATIRMANDRWRAGFGGGMMMQNGGINMKSSMMFKQFNRRTKIAQNMQKI
ncbi:hypothetical protein Tcan_11773 [Toxocara canis]|uniref:Uncharacterized protein n=1 Tax=Toxocara canis TaxID=6265 RepID=A0A0B2UNJ6_TOXCA|nr:hypothetical protein Tcan_11773 [Toxocara canis]